MEISSPAFSNGDEIPEKYGYKEENIHPPLKFSGIPEEAETLAVIVDDPDAQEVAGKVWGHWLIWNISPETKEIGEGQIPIGSQQGKNDYGGKEYGGPNPPDQKHVYRFKLYALDTELELDSSTEKGELEEEIQGNIVSEASLKGTYTP